MSELTKPFQLVPDRKLSKVELVTTIRQALVAEHDAVAQYTLQAAATDDALVRTVLLDIADEERVHAGELMTLLEYLTENEKSFLQKGEDEVTKKANELVKERTVEDK